MTIALPASIAAAAAALCLAACGPDTVSAPTVSMTPSPSATAASPTPSARITGSPTPPPATATPHPPASTSGAIGQTLTLDPGSVPAGSAVRVSGYDPSRSCGSMTILSNAFPGPQEFAGVHAVTAPVDATGHFGVTVTIAATTAPGQYPVTVRACGGNFGAQLTLTVTG